jgi:tRNA1Val (adenine37-N6)-methyltransferase
MKLGTDSVLIGAWAPLKASDERILDVGTGTGVIALMVAQRIAPLGHARIDAIDIDLPSVEEATHNFEISPWGGALRAMHIPLQEYEQRVSSGQEGEKYDLVVSNPPFFVNSLKAPSQRRSHTRHTDSLPHKDLIASAFSLLKEGGRLVVILPNEEGDAFIRSAELYNIGISDHRRLALRRICKVRTVERKPPKRYIMEFVLAAKSAVLDAVEEEYLSMNGDDRYADLLRDYLITL